jgi:hypothetical protein
MAKHVGTFEGGCLCGAIRFRCAAGDAPNTYYCHCRLCQRASGAPVVAWASYPAERVSFLKGQPAWHRSSPLALRGFCSHCGTPLAWQAETGKNQLALTLASFDHPDELPPSTHVWTESKMQWFAINDTLPSHPQKPVQ